MILYNKDEGCQGATESDLQHYILLKESYGPGQNIKKSSGFYFTSIVQLKVPLWNVRGGE